MSAVDEDAERQRLLGIIRAIDKRGKFLDQMKERQQQGWKVARTCASILKEGFGASKVVLFGSLLDHTEMTPHSDIDLAVWGLPEKDFFKAGAALDRAALESGYDFPPVDLVEIQHAKPHIFKAIVTEGIEL